MVSRLVQGPASMKELATPLSLALPSALKHLQALEIGGIVTSSKTGRVRTFAIRQDGLRTIQTWLADHQRELNAGFDRLEAAMRATPEETSE
ncbi:MAG: ArsR/SmtB family transcription factor [Devosia sp.]|jgi:DNA-binding transcriptional ArsR family regulator|uniref:ArsR/SmtB family transcription factor n=1 Tax=Devosia sp. XGJD_8 TaxID=3391187 RepID=UPI00393953AE